MKLSILTASLTAILCAGPLAGCSDDDPARTAAPPECPVLTDDDANPDQIKGEPGSYALTARGQGASVLACIALPAGYTNFGDFAVSGVGDDDDDPFRAIQYWTVWGVYDDPCRGTPSEIGPSARDLATALLDQQVSRVTRPQVVSVGGYDAVALELTVPATVRLDACNEGGYYKLWQGRPGDAHHTVGAPGTHERIWIVDVDGERVVLSAIWSPDATDVQSAELTEIVESVEFVSS